MPTIPTSLVRDPMASFVLLAALVAYPASWMRGSVIYINSQADATQNGTVAGLGQAKDMGATHVALQYMWAQANSTSSEVYANNRTPTQDGLQALVESAHDIGLGVLLKPMVVGEHGELMPTLSPTDPAAWFAAAEHTQNTVELFFGT